MVIDTGFGAPTGTRTQDPLIKSQLLYQLSYWCIYGKDTRRAKAKTGNPQITRFALVSAPTYLPGQLPAKYCQHG